MLLEVDEAQVECQSGYRIKNTNRANISNHVAKAYPGEYEDVLAENLEDSIKVEKYQDSESPDCNIFNFPPC